MRYLLALTAFFICIESYSQKVANYHVGSYGTKQYEHLSFYKDHRIEYSYGKNGNTYVVHYLGSFIHDRTGRAFRMQLPGNIFVNVLLVDNMLIIHDNANKYIRTYEWEYVGPVNGIGTYCSSCADSPEAAMKFIKKNFL